MIEITPPVRVRFAPSPTGYLHIGGVRTALFNWLFARHYGGQFILRIEDTDEKRYVPGAADDIMASLRWVGIEWDEGPDIGGPHGPYIQSLRFDQGIYQVYSAQLLESGHAYMSFTTEEELAQLRADAEMRGVKAFRFRGPERDWPLERQRELAATGKPYTIRLKTPLTGQTTFTDLVRGAEGITVQNDQLQDIVLIKTSGMPVYHFAHLVDDHLMRITHVLRAEEWVPSTPYHVLLYQAFGWEPPVFAHLPVILRQDGKGKLSKRKDDVATNRFWERGYLPEAMMNYLALQGWSYDDKTEIMSREELIERFTIDRVQASPARWNPEKLRDMNGIYIRKLAPEDLAERLLPFLAAAGLIGDPPSEAERAYVV
ncbi:MAG: glutamate--tRNA ligase, partial [Chloroflexaceae bacterium]